MVEVKMARPGEKHEVVLADGTKRKATRDERAALKATRRLRTMRPMLEAYAEKLVGKKVKVVPGRQTMTNGETIFIEPPFELSKPINHTKGMCNKRDEYNEALCEGCRIMDKVLTMLHHEMAHIIHGSFNEYEFDSRMHDKVLKALNKHSKVTEGFEFGKGTCRLSCEKETTLAIANAVYFPLVMMVQAIEDCRINRAAFDTHPVLEDMLRGQVEEVIVDGIQRPDGSRDFWSDRDKSSQMTIQILATFHDVGTEGYLDEQVIEDFNELNLFMYTQKLYDEEVEDAEAALMMSAEIVSLLFDKGYFSKVDEDSLADLIRTLMELLGHGPSPDEAKGLPGLEKAGSQYDHDHGNCGEDGDEDGNDSNSRTRFREAFDTVVAGGEALDGVPLNIDGIQTFAYPDGDCFGRAANVAEASSSARNKAVSKARRIFEENERVHLHRNQKRGKLDTRALGKRAALGDDRLFQNKTTPDSREYEVIIGLDISGSTVRGALHTIKSTALAMADVCHRTGIKFEIWAHTGIRGERTPYSAALYKVKELNQPWNTQAKMALASLQGGGVNLDGHTMQFYRKRLDASKCTDKVMFYFTDGAMPAANGEAEAKILRKELKVCKSNGYHVVGVGIGTDSPKAFGMDTVAVNGPDDIGLVLDRLATKVAR